MLCHVCQGVLKNRSELAMGNEKAVFVKAFSDPLENRKQDELEKSKKRSCWRTTIMTVMFSFSKRRFSDYAAKQAPIADTISFVEVERLIF
jgi:hypothetical protein